VQFGLRVVLLQLQEFFLFGKPFFRLFVAGSILFWTQTADAHLVSTGAGPFYDGTAHFFLTYEEILPVIALALLAGLRGARYGRWFIAVLPIAWIIGAVCGLFFPKLVLPPALNMVFLLLVPGVLLALDWNLSFKGVLAISALFGFFLGFSNGIAFSQDSGIVGIAGSMVAALIISILCSSLAVAFSRGWTRIAIRVAGSWLAALGLLALGWSFKN
jgi:hydrogenase/urease accessory protein HupE